MIYVTHARTPQELQAEVITDLNRRLALLQGQRNVLARSQAEKSRLDCAIREFEDMLRYWTSLQITRTPRRRPTE